MRQVCLTRGRRKKHSTKRNKKMLDLNEFNELEPLKQLDCLLMEAGLTVEDLATIIQEELSLVRMALENGEVVGPTKQDMRLSTKLEQFYSVLAGIFDLVQYSEEDVKKLLDGKDEFISAPWYPKTLRQYLFADKFKAVQVVADWLYSY